MIESSIFVGSCSISQLFGRVTMATRSGDRSFGSTTSLPAFDWVAVLCRVQDLYLRCITQRFLCKTSFVILRDGKEINLPWWRFETCSRCGSFWVLPIRIPKRCAHENKVVWHWPCDYVVLLHDRILRVQDMASFWEHRTRRQECDCWTSLWIKFALVTVVKNKQTNKIKVYYTDNTMVARNSTDQSQTIVASAEKQATRCLMAKRGKTQHPWQARETT